MVDSQRVQHARDVACLGLLVVAAGRARRKAEPAQVGNDDPVVPGQFGRERSPHVARLAVAVQQHDGRPMAADAHMERGAVGGDLLDGEVARKGDDRRSGGDGHDQAEGGGNDAMHGNLRETGARSLGLAAFGARMGAPRDPG